MNTTRLALFVAMAVSLSCTSIATRPNGDAIACNVAVEISLGGVNSHLHKSLLRRSDVPTVLVWSTDESETPLAVAPNCSFPPLQFFSRQSDIPKDVNSLKVTLIPAAKGLVIVTRIKKALNRSGAYDELGSSAGTDVYTRAFIESQEGSVSEAK